MERYIRILMLVIFVVFGLIKSASAATVATSFQLPLANYPTSDGCLEWGGYNSAFPGQLHVADDACAASGTDVLAVANGIVKFAGPYKSCTNWGYLIIIEHVLSDGSVVNSIYGHIDPIDGISAGVEVSKGQHIGDIVHMTCWSDHIHFGIYDGPYSEITCSYDANTGSGSCNAHGYVSDWPGNYVDPIQFVEEHQLDCSDYTSEYATIKSEYGSMIGSKDGNPYNYDGVCAQNYDDSGTSDGTSAIFYDVSGEARQAYLIRSGFWTHYDNVCGGPAGNCNQNGVVECGAPINDEYYNGTNAQGYGTARQDFQTCYLYWNGTTATTHPYPEVAPGWFDDGWNGNISYAFAEAYENNGARNTLGEATDVVDGATVHRWGFDDTLPYVQDFDGGTYGWSILMYNEDHEQAFMITGDIWDHYNNYGPEIYGPPCDDLQDTSTGAIQYFEHAIIKWKSSTGGISVKTNSGCSSYSISAITTAEETWDEGYTSSDLTSLASVDYADLSSSVTCAVDEADSLYVVLNGQDGRIYEFETTDDGDTWTSSHLTSLAAVPYSADGTTPHIFIDADTGDRYVTFMGDNARVNLFHYNGTSWTAVELTSVVAAPLGDSTTSPYGYIANGVIYVVFQGDDQRIWRFSVNGTTYGSLDLTGQAAVEYAMPGTSPQAVYNDLTGEHHIVFQGVNQRIQRLTYNGATWSSVEITSVINSDLLDSGSQPFSYVDPITGYNYVVINGNNERIDWIADETAWNSAELTSIASVPLTQPGTSPTGYVDPFTGNHVVTFQGDDERINQFEGPTWTSIDLTSQAAVEYAATGTSPASCVDPFTGVRHVVFVGENGRIQYLRFGP